MSGLAEILLEEGFTVTGSDSHETGLTDHLTDRGARVYYGQRAANIEKEPGIDVVVYTAAIHEDNPEFMAVKEKGIPMLSRAELLGEMMRNYKQAVGARICLSRRPANIPTASCHSIPPWRSY